MRFERATFSHADNGPGISHEAAKLNQRGLDHLHKKEYEQAIASFREALKIQPEYPDAFDNLGKALESTGKDAEAIADFDKAIKIAPEKAAVYADKGLALFHEGKYEDAAASYRQAIEHHKDFSEAQNGLGASLLHLGKNDEAIAASGFLSRPLYPTRPKTEGGNGHNSYRDAANRFSPRSQAIISR